MLVPDIVMLVGVSVAVSPVALTVEVRLTVPLNPLRAEMVIVEDPEPPTGIVSELGLAVIVKSGVVTWSVMVAVVCDSKPLVPVTVTV